MAELISLICHQKENEMQQLDERNYISLLLCDWCCPPYVLRLNMSFTFE